MIADSISFCGRLCFNGEWVGFSQMKPVNVIIGRNNVGKSQLLDLVRFACDGKTPKNGWRFRFSGVLDRETLARTFEFNRSGAPLQGEYWRDHGALFEGKEVVWATDTQGNVTEVHFPNFLNHSVYGVESTKARETFVMASLRDVRHWAKGKSFRRLLADRDIKTEEPANELNLSPDGSGSTNIIRRYIVTSHSQFPRDIIQKNVLDALNQIFGDDGRFKEIQVKHHDEPQGDQSSGHWEIFLGEAGKGLISLSKSGSGLKTVILVLLNLIVIPEIEKKKKSSYFFAFEELENNLHPALLRRLLRYIEDYAVGTDAKIFLTTHSSAALDYFGVSKNA